jgi:hypothetical protein
VPRRTSSSGIKVSEELKAAFFIKPVFTYGVLKLVEQVNLGLDVPLTSYLPKPFVATSALQRLQRGLSRAIEPDSRLG